MKPARHHTTTSRHPKLTATLLACLAITTFSAHGAEVLKLNSGNLYDAVSWNGGVLPTTADIGVFDSSTVPSSSGATFSGSNFYIGGYKITDIEGDLHINGSTTYIFNGGVLDMSAATSDVYFDGTLRTNGPSSGANYTITVASGRTLALYQQTFSRNAYTMPINGGGTVLVNGSTNGGGTNRVAYDVTGSGTTIGGTGSWVPSNTNGGYGVRMNSGTYVSPGANGVGTTTFSGVNSGQSILTMGLGSAFEFELGTGGTIALPSANSDMISLVSMVAGDVIFNGNNIDFLGTGSTGWFKLFDTDFGATTYTGLTLSGQQITGGLTFSNLASGLTGALIMGDGTTGDAGDIYFNAVAIPEPGAALLGGMGVLALLRRRRK